MPQICVGTSGNDNLCACADQSIDYADIIYGLEGDDTLAGGYEADILDGGEGGETQGDTVDYCCLNPTTKAFFGPGFQGVTVRLDLGWAIDRYNFTDQLFNIENIIGTCNPNWTDVLVGDGQNNKIWGRQGPDSIQGGTGNDSLWGDGGQDTIDGGDNDDELQGGARNDLLMGGLGQDTVWGDSGNDTIRGGHDNDTIYGGSGDDQIYAEWSSGITTAPNSDLVYAGLGNDTVDGDTPWQTNTTAADTIYGEDGNDLLRGWAGDDSLIGGSGKDTLIGGTEKDVFDFNAESDSPTLTPDVIAQSGGVAFDAPGSGVGDVIDLEDVISGLLTFRPNGAAFSAISQVRVISSGINSVVEVNLSGSASPEMRIIIQDGWATSSTSYTAADFFL